MKKGLNEEKDFLSSKERRGKRAFTLTEVLIVITFLVVIIEVVYTAYVLSQKSYYEGVQRAEVSQNGRVILERITRELRQAKEMVTELSDSEAQATSTIEFEDGHATTSYNYIHYYQEGSEVKREVKKYYFPSDPNTFLAWNTTSPTEVLTATTTDGPAVIGEHLSASGGLKFWGDYVVNVRLSLEKGSQQLSLLTKVLARNR